LKLLRFLLLLLFCTLELQALESRFPEPKGEKPVHDFADILNESQESLLNQFLIGYADTTATQIVIVIMPTIDGEDPNLYAAELGEQWGVGGKNADNGMVFLVAVKDRKMAIQNGYGLEPYLTDAKTKLIIENYILPQFRKKDYYEGIKQGTEQIVNLLQGKFKAPPQKEKSSKKPIPYLPLVFIIILIILIFRYGSRGGGKGGGYRSGGGGIWLGGLGSGGSSFGGGGGGFSGGFGGGSFGGGGASGSW
jgi:uncharacterized protein